MAPQNPSPEPGDPPHPNPGQTNPGTRYTALDSGQDVRRPGTYFSTLTHALAYFTVGGTMPGNGDTWYFVSDDRDLSLDDAADALRQYGFRLNPGDLYVGSS